MKQKLIEIRQKVAAKHPPTIITIVMLVLSLITVVGAIFSFSDKSEVAKAENIATTTPYRLIDDSSIVAVVGADATISGNIAMSNSWPGEIISSEISQIQPQREGVITEWRVRIGDVVSAGQVLGKVSAAPAMPELITMLTEKAEMAARAKAEAVIADEFASKEQRRFEALKNALEGNIASSTDLSLTALSSMRKEADTMRNATRSFIERALSRHVVILSNFIDWRSYRYGGLYKRFGINNSSLQDAFELSFIRLADKLKSTSGLPIEEAENYFALATQLANNSGNSVDEPDVAEFKMTAADDQMDFLEMLSDYRMAQSKVSNMETEYKIMINEDGSMVEKDRGMAHAEADAAEVAYNTIAREITGGSYIISPRAGAVSAIYKKVGDLVDPMMPIAVIAGLGDSELTVRIRIPNNILKPLKGDLLSVVRPGFPRDIYKAKVIGIGMALDETGSYMADAVLADHVDWPAGASVRIIPPENSNMPIIKLSSVVWNEDGTPIVWGVSNGGRIFSKKITIGRTLGTSVEVYGGLKDGDRYLVSPTSDIRENMLLEDAVPKESMGNSSAKSGEKGSMAGMEM